MTEFPPWAIEKLRRIGGEPLDGDEDFGKYEIVREIARGGMGVVYEAIDTQLKRRVALKVFGGSLVGDPRLAKRFLREVSAAVRLSHPNIAQVYDANHEFIAMQYIDGTLLSARPQRAPREVARLIRDAARAVHYAHTEGIVHRDLKPSNLMLEGRHLYVLDFGLAKDLAGDSSVSQSGAVIGTPSYMSPEQASGRHDLVGPSSDIYALGATLYQQLCGHPPHAGVDVYDVLRKVAHEEPRPLAKVVKGLDRDLETIVMKCLELDPRRRYATAEALAADLDCWIRDEPILARPPSTTQRVQRFVARRRWPILAAALAVIALTGFGILRMQRDMARDSVAKAEHAVEFAASIAVVVDDAWQSYSEGDLNRATELIKTGVSYTDEYLGDHGDLAFVHFTRGRLLRMLGNVGESLAELNRALELMESDHYRFERGLLMAEAYGARVVQWKRGEGANGGEIPAALEELRLAALEDLRRMPDEVRRLDASTHHYATALVLWLEKDFDQARRRFIELSTAGRLALDSRISLTCIAVLTSSDEDEARHSISPADFGQSYDVPFITRGDVLELADVEDLTRDVCRVAVLSAPVGPPLLEESGLLASIEYEQLSDCCRRLKEIVKDARGYASVGRGGAAEAAFEHVIEHFNGHASSDAEDGLPAAALNNCGLFHLFVRQLDLKDGDPESAAEELAEACEDFSEALERDADLLAARFNLALCRLLRSREMEDASEALGLVTQAISGVEVVLAAEPESELAEALLHDARAWRADLEKSPGR